MKKILLFILIAYALTPCFASQNKLWFKTITYSHLIFNAQEGEVNGLEVIYLPSSNGLQVLWRLGNGKMEDAILVTATEIKGGHEITIPPIIDGAGKWQLLKIKNIVNVKGPRGQSFKLKQIN